MIKKYLIIVLLGIIIFYGVLWSSYSFARLGIRGNISILRFGTNMYNGSATSGATDYAYYTQALGGVDDYNDGAAQPYPTGSYQGSWTDCVVGNNYCGTGDATYADAKDNSTGLIWSIALNVAGDYTQTWFWANNCYYSGTATDCDADGEAGCRCTKLTEGNKTGCDALGSGWRLPYQKELMQAYINGSSKASVSYLSSTTSSYWSATTYSSLTYSGWSVYLSYGSTNGYTKTNSTGYWVRCVR